jgi:hypothetical protein
MHSMAEPLLSCLDKPKLRDPKSAVPKHLGKEYKLPFALCTIGTSRLRSFIDHIKATKGEEHNLVEA